MARRVAIGNNKGGAKKTTTVVRLAEALAKAGKRVLVVDLDPQGNASRRLGWKYDKQTPQLTTSEAISANAVGVASQVIQPIGWTVGYSSHMVLMPARYDLENRATEAGTVGAHRRLAKALDGADDHVDYTLIDCPPSLGHLTQMGLGAAHYALATTEPEHDSVEAAVRYRDFVQSSAGDLSNPELEFIGVVVAAVDTRIGAHTGQLEGLRTLFGADVWDPVVPRRSLITDADEYAQPLSQLAGAKTAQVRAVFELLAQTFIKAVPA